MRAIPAVAALLLVSAEDLQCPPGYSGYVSSSDCKSFFQCHNGNVVSPTTTCMGGTIFNELLNVCDFEANFVCGSTRAPTKPPTPRPTNKPTPPLVPTTDAPSLPPQTRSPNANTGVEDALQYASYDMDSKLFVYEAGWSDWLPSTQYRFDGFIRALRVMYLEGVGDLSFYLGEDVRGEEGTKIGLVNIAAFIAQCMSKTVVALALRVAAEEQS